ncbi:MAG: ABC transporter permease [Pusillimonas sp.]|nr:MAG: ABC transporter permease [Pusillimonas sp.]
MESQSGSLASRLLPTHYVPSWRLLLLLPVFLFLAALLLWPYIEIINGTVSGLASSVRTLSNSALLSRDIVNTVVISLVATVFTAILAYILAFMAWVAKGRVRLIIFAFVLLPFWTDVLVKNFAWIELLRDNGIINNFLMWLGVIHEPLHLLYTRFAVIVGMVHYCLPYAFFPIFAVLLPIDKRLDRAAISLGAGRWHRAWLVLAPLSLPGILASGLLTFIISVGFFITPVLLGGPGDQMISNAIDYYQSKLVDFHAASFLALGVSIVVTALVFFYQRIPAEGQHASA